MELTGAIQAISDLGTIGLLILIVFAFFRGAVVPKSQVDRDEKKNEKYLTEIKSHAETQTKLLAREVAESINARTEIAVARGTEKGIIAAVEFLNGGKEKSKG